MNREEWLQQRRKGIGGSDAASIIGLSAVKEERVGIDGEVYYVKPYANVKTPFQLWLDKTGKIPLDDGTSLYTQKGQAMEPLILQLYTERTGLTLLPKPEIIYHPEFPWMAASLDGWTEESVVDAKTSAKLELWGEDGSKVVPMNIYCQMQWYMMVTGKTRADVMAWLECGRFLDVRLYPIYPDFEFQRLLMRRAMAFWSHVQNDTPPAPISISDCEHLFPKAPEKKRREVTPELMSMIHELSELSSRRLETIKACEMREDECKLEILKFSEASDELTFNNRLVATISTSKTGRKTIRLKGIKDGSTCNK